MKTNERTTTSTTENEWVSRAEYEAVVRERDSFARMNAWLTEQLANLNRKTYGRSSEKASEEVSGQMSLLFDEAEAYAFLETVTEKKIPVAAYEKQKKTSRTFLMDKLPENTPVVIEEHRLSDSERVCPECGNILTEIGKDVVRTLEIIPAQVRIHEDRYFSYACSNHCLQAAGTENIVSAPHKAAVYPGSNASPEAVAYLMTQKYVMGTPLYRMEQDFSGRNIPLSRQTMSNWMIACSEKWLKPVWDVLHSRLLSEDIVHADETVLQVLHEKGKKAESNSYMWLYRTGKYSDKPVVLYQYCAGRAGKNPQEFLKGFKGYLQTDGYAGYDQVQEVVHVGCMAHLRRKFHEAVDALPKNSRKGAAVEGEAYCNALFAIEKEISELTPLERYAARLELEKPVLDEFLSWGKQRNAAPKSKLGAALTYLHNQSGKISNYLLDGRLEISNNLAERSIKPFVIDRKNFLFANTPKGAEASAVTFSIIQTAKENGLDPFRYLAYIFATAPSLDQTVPNWILPLLPENAPVNCRV